MTKKTSGERLIHMSTHQGTRWRGERLPSLSTAILAVTEIWVDALHRLFPSQSKQRVDSGCNAEHERREPKRINRTGESSVCHLERELYGGRRY